MTRRDNRRAGPAGELGELRGKAEGGEDNGQGKRKGQRNALLICAQLH